MGETLNLSKMGALEGIMLGNITAFVRALKQQRPRVIEFIKASRALEANIACD
jgi:hypothetical protein